MWDKSELPQSAGKSHFRSTALILPIAAPGQDESTQKSFTARTTTHRSSLVAFADSQLKNDARQKRLKQQERAVKLSLLKQTLKQKPSINRNSSKIAETKYTDPSSGRAVSQHAKVHILGQELVKNRPEVIKQMQQILDTQEGLSFRPEISKSSRSLSSSVTRLHEWFEKNEQKK